MTYKAGEKSLYGNVLNPGHYNMVSGNLFDKGSTKSFRGKKKSLAKHSTKRRTALSSIQSCLPLSLMPAASVSKKTLTSKKRSGGN